MTPGRASGGADGTVAPPVDASMTLLKEVMLKPLDPGYQEATDRRRAAGNPAVRKLTQAVLFVLAVALGLVTAAAAVVLRTPEPAVAQAHALLQEQIADRTAVADRLQEQNTVTARDIANLQAAALGARDPAAVARLAADGASSGTLAVSGSGLRITLADSAAARENLEQANPNERVQDVDLQVTVNGLWASGAEAIAINGHRLTATTAIRSAGSAILVDLAPLNGPYVVDAIGDPAQLETGFARTDAGQHLSALRNTYGISADFSSEDRLELPGSTETQLWSATASGAAELKSVASSPPTSVGGKP
ncbi:MAG: DUF881 domain-containing protein [Cellulomonas sp.]